MNARLYVVRLFVKVTLIALFLVCNSVLSLTFFYINERKTSFALGRLPKGMAHGACYPRPCHTDGDA